MEGRGYWAGFESIGAAAVKTAGQPEDRRRRRRAAAALMRLRERLTGACDKLAKVDEWRAVD